MATGRKLTEKERELFEENDFLKSQLERERKSNTVLLEMDIVDGNGNRSVAWLIVGIVMVIIGAFGYYIANVI